MRPRSGLASKGILVANGPGTVDAGYRAEVKALLLNTADVPFALAKGSRAIQMVIKEIPAVRLQVVNSVFVDTERGLGGFGHTGIK